ncbi:hypothetical protein, partial [Pyrobaculum sp.]|uniref:hypothetical protein n=1 Tax=Pyrobaculum sp. TaxID=2004705 RepID=UPI003D0DD935
MIAFIAALLTAVVAGYVRRELSPASVLRDAALLTFIYAGAIFMWTAWVEAGTLSLHNLLSPLWYTQVPAFRDTLWSAAAGAFTLFLSIIIEHLEEVARRIPRPALRRRRRVDSASRAAGTPQQAP